MYNALYTVCIRRSEGPPRGLYVEVVLVSVCPSADDSSWVKGGGGVSCVVISFKKQTIGSPEVSELHKRPSSYHSPRIQ